jgi:RNA polymerase sigma factor (sigma-70 family)
MAHVSKTEFVRAALDRYEAPLMRYAYRLSGDVERARDIVQETFLCLCREKPASVESHLAQWLYRVCRNRAMDLLRKERRAAAFLKDETRDVKEAAAPPSSEGEVRHDCARTLELVETLPENQREVFRLRYQSELTYQEISHVTGLTVTNVGYLIHCAVKAIRSRLFEEAADAVTAKRGSL